ncbi:MAG TPA: acetyl/propionyl-CoA carboxylase subunit alpha, partial [Rhodobiaceae bacterium]|nr:acetyl/propionyl-CoA carboxylase subunit alpha [Rhodobiaceae bacterium]
GFEGAPLSSQQIKERAVIAFYMRSYVLDRASEISGAMPNYEATLPDAMAVQVEDRVFTARFDENGIVLDDETFELESLWLPGDLFFEGKVNGQAISLAVDSMPEGYVLTSRGKAQKVFVRSLRAQELMVYMPEKRDGASSKELLCPMPGVVMSIDVEEGQEVKSGQALAVVEAMKMENILRAEKDATVKSVLVAAGDKLAVDDIMIEFE